MDRQKFLGVVEGLLFAVGEEGVSKEQLMDVVDLGPYEIDVLIGELRARYEDVRCGLKVVEMAGVYKMVTKPDHAEYFTALMQGPAQKSLSPAALEVLAIISYKQPITRYEIEVVRGVNNDAVIKKLLMFDLIEEAGRMDGPGRPMLFKTTDAFLDYFGIKTIEELPELDEDTLVVENGEVSLF